MSQSISGSLIKGTIWISAARVIVNISAAISTILLARLLTPADFGLVALGTTMLAIVASATELSLAEALVRHDKPGEEHFSSAWTLNATRGLIFGSLFALSAYPAAHFYGEARLPPIMCALGLSSFITSLANPRRIILQRSLVFWQEFVLTVSQKVAGLIASLTIAFIYHSYWALVIGTLVTSITNVIVSYCVVPFWPRVTYRHSRELLSFSIWLTLGQAINMLNWRFDHLLVGKFLGRSSLGLYTVGSTLSSMPTREMTAPLTQTIYPGFAKVGQDRARLGAAYQRVQAVVTAVALPAGFGTAIIADPVVRLSMGEKWVPAIFVIQTLAGVFALQTLGSLVEPLGMACNATRLLFIRSAQMFCVRVPIIMGAMYFDGLTGLVYARVLTGLFAAYVNMRLVRHFIDVSVTKQMVANTRSLISICVMTVGAMSVQSWMGVQTGELQLLKQIFTLVVLSGVLYCGTMFCLWELMRRPAGPEDEIAMKIKKFTQRLANSHES